MHLPKLIPWLSWLALLSFCTSLLAEEQYVIRRAVEAGQLKPLTEILGQVQKRYPGKVLDVDLERDINGRRIYEITILKNDGQRTKVLADATSGQEIQHDSGPAALNLDMPQALRKLLAQYPGRILGLEIKLASDRRRIYEVQVILQDGRLREFVIDAANGELIDASGHRQDALRRLMPLPDILGALNTHYRGTIQEIELEYDQDGRYFYEIEIRLTDGRVFELDVDAISGKLLNGEEVER